LTITKILTKIDIKPVQALT